MLFSCHRGAERKLKTLNWKIKYKRSSFLQKNSICSKKSKIKNPQCKVNLNDLHDIICLSAKRALQHALIIFFGMLFFQIPFIVKGMFARRLDFFICINYYCLFIYLVVYVSAKLKTSLCVQCELIKLAIKPILTIKL